MNVKHSDAKELVGEWVNVNNNSVDEQSAVLAELNVDPRSIDDHLPEYSSYTMSLSPDDGPLDLLWVDEREYLIIPRLSWSEKISMEDIDI